MKKLTRTPQDHINLSETAPNTQNVYSKERQREEFSFQNMYQQRSSLDRWKERAKSTKRFINKNQYYDITNTTCESQKMQNLIRNQREQIQKLRHKVKQQQNLIQGCNPQQASHKVKDQYYQKSSWVQYNYFTPHESSRFKYQNQTSFIQNSRDKSPTYSKIHSFKKIPPSQTLQTRRQKLYELNISSLKDTIQLQNKQMEIIQSQNNIKALRMEQLVKQLTLRIQQQKETKLRQMKELRSKLENEYFLMLKQKQKQGKSFEVQENKGQSKTKLKNICGSNFRLVKTINFCIIPTKQQQIDPNKIQKLSICISKEKKEISDINSRLRDKSLELKQRVKSMTRIAGTNSTNNCSQTKKLKEYQSYTNQNQMSNEAQKVSLENQIKDLKQVLQKSTQNHQIQLKQLRTSNTHLSTKLQQSQLQILILEQKLSIKECMHQISQQYSSNPKDLQICESQIFSNSHREIQAQTNVLSVYSTQVNNSEIKQNQKVGQLQKSVIELKDIIASKDEDIVMLISRYQDIEEKLTKMIEVNQKISKLKVKESQIQNEDLLEREQNEVQNSPKVTPTL